MKGKKILYELMNPSTDEIDVHTNSAIFHNANGYIGIRYNFEEGYPDDFNVVTSQYINGVYDYVDMPQAENLCGFIDEKQTMLAVANTQQISLSIDGEKFSMYEGEIKNWSLSLDMEKGVTLRKVRWKSPKGKEIFLEVSRMASFYQLPLFLIEYKVKALNFHGEITIESVHDGNAMNYVNPNDPRSAHSSTQYIIPANSNVKDEVSYIVSRTTRSGIEICSAVDNQLSCVSEKTFDVKDDSVVCTMSCKIKEGHSIKLDKYTVMCDSLRYNDPAMRAREEINKARTISVKELHKKQEEHLADYWENCYVEIDCEDDLSDALTFNMYHLNQSASRDSYGNIAPKGLSGEGYEGHIFWDTEMYMIPFFTITNPRISKTLLESRHRQLEYALENAKRMGHSKGALYPWRTITGKECSGYFPSGAAQYHINGAIAYAISSYYFSTKDFDFIVRMGAEMIFETARLWIDTGVFQDGKFYINDVSGPDEYTCIVNNNYYTNSIAQFHLRQAVKFYDMLSEKNKIDRIKRKIKLKAKEIREFAKAADEMFLPYDEALGINPQDDSFLNKEKWDISSIPPENFPLLLHYHPLHIYRHQICKQADTVMAYCILEDMQDRETMKRSFEYYEKITTHDSSLSKSIFSIVAARLGKVDKAYEYFGDSAMLDILNLHNNTKDGIHTSNMAGSILTVVYGFGGLRIKYDGIHFTPILPPKWNKYCFKMIYEGSGIKILVNREKVVFTLRSGDPKELEVYGKKYLLEDELIIKRPHDDCSELSVEENDEI